MSHGQTPEPLPEIQRLAQLLVAITVELGEPGDTLFNDLPRLVREQHARVAELAAERDTARDVARKMIDSRARDIVAEEAAQYEPHAYIAVLRQHSPNAEGPEWFDQAIVFPATDPDGIREGLERRPYEFLPVVGTETGTRFATAVGRCQTTIAHPANGHSLWCELPHGHAGMHHVTIPQPGYPDGTADWDDPAEAQEVQQ